jgi:hypothetical protein
MEHPKMTHDRAVSSEHAMRLEPASLRARLVFALFRWVVYGTVMCVGELFFYNLIRLGRALPVVQMLFQFDWQVDPALKLNGIWATPPHMLYGQCSLWMFPEYAFALLLMIEPLSRWMHGRSVLLRALVYGVAILLYEGLTGLLLKGVLGYAVWCYRDAYAILEGSTTLLILPACCLIGLYNERVTREVNHPAVCSYVMRRFLTSRGSS